MSSSLSAATGNFSHLSVLPHPWPHWGFSPPWGLSLQACTVTCYTWEAGSSDGVFNHLIYHLPHLYLNKQPKRLLMTGSKRYLEKVFWDWLSEVIFVKPCFLVIWTHFQWTHRVHEIYLTMVLTKHDNIISYNVHIPPKKNLEHTSDYSIWNARWFVTLPV